MTIDHIALIGFGEVGQIVGADLLKCGIPDLIAWDVKFSEADSPPACALRISSVTAGDSARHAATHADLVISAVTAEQTINAAKDTAPGLQRGAFYLDMNSASPAVKKAAARVIEDSGGRYVEAAVIAPFPPKRLASPILLGGPHGQAFLDAATRLGFTGAEMFSSEIGKASAVKMCRSIMVKGVEALLMEALLTARHHGVEETVLSSLSDLFPGPDWRNLARYMISRSVIHGKRRAEEMREAARTVYEAGVTPLVSESIAKYQDRAPNYKKALSQDDLGAMLESILGAIDNLNETAS